MKKDTFFSKNKILIVTVLVLIAVTVCGVLFLNSRAEDHGTSPIKGINNKRSHIALTGEKYKLNDEQEKQYLKEEKIRQKNIEEKKKDEKPVEENIKKDETKKPDNIMDNSGNGDSKPENPDKPGDGDNPGDNPGGDEPGGGDDSGDGTEEPGEEPDEPGPGEDPGEDESKLPTIICSLRDGDTLSGNFISFTVKAVSYKNEVLRSSDVSVKLNGNKMYSSGETGGTISYRTSDNLNEGSNQVVITATDRDGNSATVTYNVKVNKEEERKEGGTMRVKLSADVLGLGTIFDVNVVFYEGENLPYVVDRAFNKAGIRYTHTGRFDYGFYLNRIYKTGITNGYKIPDPIQAKLDEVNCSWLGYETDSLGEKDFYEHSGWMYMLDGEFPNGFSTKAAEDGSEIEMVFTTNYGYEFDGTWFDGNW